MTKKTLTAVLLSSVLLSSVCAVPFAGAAEQNNTDANEEQNSGISTENGEENNYYTATPADEVTDTETVECYVLYRVSDVYTAHFLNEYQASLEKSGISAEEAKTMTGELRKQINENGAITDPEIEKQRQEYCTQKIDEEMDKACQTIGVDRKDVTIVRNEMSHCIKGEMTSKQITAAETLTRNYAIVTVGDEVGKYKGKIANKLLLDKIREGEENIEVSVRIKSASGELGTVTDKERTSYVKDIFDAAGIDSFGSINQTMFKYLQIDDEFIYLLETETTLNAEQLEKLCEADEVLEVTALPPWHQAEPTVEPTEPVVAPPSEYVTGDLNSDGIVDVTDLTELSLALLGDRNLSENQKKAADVDDDGAVTLADLARLRQYLSKKIDSLTDDKDADTVVQEKEVKYSAAISVRVTDNKLDEYPQHSIIEDRAGFEALYNEKQSLEIEKTGFYSGGIFPILNDKYTDEWFETHKLYVAYPGKGGPTGYRYNVESVTNKAVTIHWDQLGESQSRTENKADWIIFIEVSKDADVTDATEIKFNTVF